jgi:hypothetical protein
MLPTCAEGVAELGAGAAVAPAVLELAGALAAEDPVGPVAEVQHAQVAHAQGAGVAFAVVGALRAGGGVEWVVGAAFGVVAGLVAASAGCAIDEDGELVATVGLVVCAEAPLGGGGCGHWPLIQWPMGDSHSSPNATATRTHRTHRGISLAIP